MRAQGSINYQADLNENFTPSFIPAGGITTLSIIIYNPNSFALKLLDPALVDVLDPRLSFTNPPNIRTDCNGTVSIIGQTLTLIGGTVPAKIGEANGSCSILVDVTSTTPGNIPNTLAVDLLKATDPDGTINVTNKTPASKDLLVNSVQPPSMSKTFSPNTIWVGRTSILTITIRNNDTNTALNQVALTDNLPANIKVAASPNATTTCNGATDGSVTAVPGTNSISLSNGTVPLAGSCTISTTVTSATAGVYTNLIPSNSIRSQQGVTNASAASAPLNVQAIGLTKQFSPANFQNGNFSRLTITLQNPTGAPYHNATLTDNFPAGLIIANPANASTNCTNGTVSAVPGSGSIGLSGGIIPPGNPGGCVVQVDVTSTTPASYTNTIPVGALTTTEGASNVVAATANISVYATGLGLNARKWFAQSPIAVNGRSQLNIALDAPGDSDLHNVTLTDALPGGVYVDATPGASTIGCNSGVFAPQVGDTQLHFSGGTIIKGTTCTLQVYVTSSTPGTYTNTISPANISNTENRNISGNISGSLVVSGISVSKLFMPTSVNPGGISTLSITLSNDNLSQLEEVSFSDQLPATSSSDGVFLADDPNIRTTCGTPDIISVATNGSGIQTITMTGGIIPAKVGSVQGICTVNIDVVGKGGDATYANRIHAGDVSGKIHGTSTYITNPSEARADLQVLPIRIDIVKEFAVTSVFSGSATTLTVYLTNPNSVPLTGIHFTDNFPNPSPGRGMKVATPANASVGTCGGSLAAIPGDFSFTFSDGYLAANATCALTLQVTMNVNGNLINTIGAGTVKTSNGATNPSDVTATLTNEPAASVSKLFGPNPINAGPGNSSTLTITIQNFSNFPISGVGLVDTLPSNMAVTEAPTTTCTNGSVTEVAGVVTLTGAQLDDLSNCEIMVKVSAPTAGLYPNCIAKGALTSTDSSATNVTAACDTLNVLAIPEKPVFSKDFSPKVIPTGSPSALTFTLTNPVANSVPLTGVGFTDTFPAGLTIASVPNAAQCNGGVVSYTPNSITLTGGTIPINNSCSVVASVTSGSGGTYPNTSGNVSWTFNGTTFTGDTASDTITVVAPPVISKLFAPQSIYSGDTSNLTFTIVNPSENTVGLAGVGFTDLFPIGLTVAAAPATSQCGGTVSSTSGSITLAGGTIPVNSSCTVSVDVTGGGGIYPNTSDPVTSTNGGPGNTAADTLTISGGGLLLAKSTSTAGFQKSGDIIDYAYLITNTGDITLFGNGGSGEFTVNDDKAVVSCPLGTTNLNPGESVTCTAQHTVTLAEANARSVTNTATATAKDTNENPFTSNTDSVTVRLEALRIKKQTSTLGFRNVGDAIIYSYTLTNTGDVPLYGNGPTGEFMVLDDHIGTLPPGTAFACDPAIKTLAPGANLPCAQFQTYHVTGSDLSTGSVTNKVTAEARDKATGGNTVASNEDQVTVYQVAPPTIAKEFDGSTIPVGGISTLKFTITNPPANPIPLIGVSFVDTFPEGVTVANPPDSSQCGGNISYTDNSITLTGGTVISDSNNINNQCTIMVSVTAGAAGSYNNTSQPVTSSNGGEGLASNTATLTVIAPPVITKAFSPAIITTIAPNNQSTITFTLTNPNQGTPLTEVSFTDELPANLQVAAAPNISMVGCGASIFSPPAGATSMSFTAGTIAAGDQCLVRFDVVALTYGVMENTTSVVTSKEGGSGSTSNTAILYVNYPHLTLEKTIQSGDPYKTAGATINYQYVLTNDGNVTLIGDDPNGLFTITDSQIGSPKNTAFTCPPTPAGLEPGKTLTCTAIYPVTQDDLNYGSVTNVATAHGRYGSTKVDSNTASLVAKAVPLLSKVLTSTEFESAGYHLANQAAVGERAVYTLTVTVPKGTTPNVVLTDLLDSGLSFVEIQSFNLPGGVTIANPPGTGATPSGVTISDNGGTRNQLVFNFGDIENTNTDFSVQQTISIVYKSEIINISSNQSGTLLKNNATLAWTGDSVIQNTPTTAITVIEPTLTLAKSRIVTGHDAGDTTTFSVTVTNGNAPGDAIAFDAGFQDVIPAGLTYVANSAATSCSNPPDFAYDGGTTTLTASWATFPTNSSCTFTFDTQLAADVYPGQTIPANLGELRWTSLPGPRPGERIGEDGLLNSGALNDYRQQSSTPSFSVDAVQSEKKLVATSEAHTSGTDMAIGEIARYRLVLQLPESTVENLQFREIFAGTGGQRFLNDGTARVLFVGNGKVSSANYPAGSVPAIDPCLNYPGDFTLDQAANPAVIPSASVNCVLADANISDSEIGNSDQYPTNGEVHFQLGTISNSDDDPNAEYIIVEFNTLVTNETANINGSSLSDSFIGRRWNGTSMVDLGSESPAAVLTVRQPDLTVSKTLASTPVDAGDTVAYDITITSAGIAADHATGFDIHLTDVLDANLEPVSEMITGTTQTSPCSGNGAGTTVFSSNIGRTGQNVDLTATCLDPGQSITARINARVIQLAHVGITIPNQANLTYTSLPGDHGTTTNPTQSAVVSDPGTETGERIGTGTAPNTYTFAANISFTLASPTLVKVDPNPTAYTIGDTVQYDIRVTLPEGVTPNLVVTDNIPSGIKPTGSLPYGLKYVSSQVLANDPALTQAFSGPTDISLVSGVCAGTCATGDDVSFTFNDVITATDNNDNNNTFIIRVVLLVENVRGNQDRIPSNAEYPTSLTNTVTATYTGGSANASSGPIHVIEPRITTSKSVDLTTNVKPGDTLHYTARFTNTGNSPAYDVTALDIMAQGVRFGAVTGCTYYNGVSSAAIPYTTSVSTISGLDNISLDGSPAGSWDIPVTTPNAYIECVYTGIVQNNVVLNGSHINTVDANWSSQNGVQPNERTYNDSTPYNFDGSQDTATAAFTTGLPTLSKSDNNFILGTIGDSITYTLTVGGANVIGTLQSLVVTDTLPAGLIYDGGATINGFSTSPTPTVSSPNNGTVPVSIQFNFGDTFKSVDNATITYQAHIADVTGNAKGVARTNSVSATYLNLAGSTVNLGPATDGFTIAEPVITTTKSVDHTTNVKAGDILHYTARFTNTGNSPAYDVTALDIMAQGVKFGAVTGCNYYNGSSAAAIPYSTSVSTISGLDNISFDGSPAGGWDIPVTTPNAYIECSYTGIVQNSVVLNGSHINTVDADWSSQEGTTNPGERVYGDTVNRPNVDGSQDTATAAFTTGLPTLSKSDNNFILGTIGDSITYTLTVGGANVIGTLQSLVVTDTLPAGLIYDGGVTFNGFSTSPTPTVSSPNNGTVPVSIQFNFGDTFKSVDNATITYQAHIADVTGNAKGVSRTNSVSATYLNLAGSTVNLGPATDGFTIAEPVITTTKSVDHTTNVKAGDTLHYTARFTNTGNSPAYDVTALDIMAQGVRIGAVTGCTYYNGVSSAAIPYATSVSTISGLDNISFDGSPAGSWDIPVTTPNAYIECVYTGIAQPDLYLDGSHTNTVDADWSSQDGTTNSGERVYDDTVNRPNVDGNQDTANATFTSGAPTITKDDGGVTHTVIGQTLHFTLTLNSPLGTLQNAKIEDDLPAGLIYVANSQVVGPGISAATFSSQGPEDGSGAVKLTWDFGSATVSTSPFTLQYDAIVANVASNQNYTVLTNTATLSYTNVAGSTQSVSSSESSTVTEPILNITKSAASVSLKPDAGDEITYTVTIAHDNDGTLPDSTATAYEVNFLDVLPAYADLQIGTVSVAGTGAATISNTSDDGANTVKISISELSIGTTATITYKAILTQGLVPNQKIENTGFINWSSQAGNNNPGAFNGERDGSGGINDYQNSATATLYAADVIPLKSIVSTSEAHTPETGNGSDSTSNARLLAIGEIVRYRLAVQIPEGTSPNFQVTDIIPAGLTFMPNTLTLQYQSDTGIGNADPTADTDLNGANGAAIPLPAGYYIYTSGSHTLTIDLKTLVNKDNDENVEQVWLEYNALVNNDAFNNNGTVHDNFFMLQVNGHDNLSNHVYTRVTEPVLLLGKTANADTNWKYGDTILYTLNLTSSLSSTAEAFNLRIEDSVPPGLTFLGFTSTPTGWVADSSAAPVLVWTCDADTNPTCSLPVNGSAAFSYQVKVNIITDPFFLHGNDTATNTATLVWTSLPGSNGTVTNPTGSSTPGNSGAPTGERNGSGIPIENDYTITASHTGRLLLIQSLTVVKSSTTSAVTAAGQVVPYSYLVTNTGNVTVTGILVSDNHVDSAPSCPAASLAVGAQMTCTAQYTLTQPEIDAGGSLTNQVTVTSTNAPTVSDTLSIPVNQNRVLTIHKSANPLTYAAVGTVIHYTYLLTNSGLVTLTGPFTVSDDKATDEACPAGDLAPGDSLTCTASYTITQDDLDAGSVTNIASASNGTVTSPTDSVKVIAVQTPALTIAKSADPLTYSVMGTVIDYNYLLTNNGNVTLSGPFSVSDDKAVVTCSSTPNLAVGDTLTCTSTYTITQSDLDLGSLTNKATGHALFGGITVDSAETSVTITSVQTPGLTLVKSITSGNPYGRAGDVIAYSYKLTNSGNVTLKGPGAGDIFTVTDDKVTVTCPAGQVSLPPGNTITCTANYIVTSNDLDGSVVNHATGHALFGATPVDSNEDTQTAIGTHLTASKLATDVDGDGIVTPGDVLEYSIVVTNTGLSDALAAVFSDTPGPHTTLVAGSVISSLPGSSVTTGNNPGDLVVSVDLGKLVAQTGSATITFRVQIDTPLPAGVTSVSNQGQFTGSNFQQVTTDNQLNPQNPGHPTVTPVIGTPRLSAVKTASLVIDPDNSVTASPGDTLLYTITITNNGDAAETSVVFSDTPDTNTTLVVGTVHSSQGTVSLGNAAGNTTVAVNLGTLPGAGGQAVINFRVLIKNQLPAGTNFIHNQGAVTGQATNILTDDPITSQVDDPTLTPVVGPTAVSLLYFRATPLGNLQVQLTWATAVEVNNYGFIIKRGMVNDYSQAVEVGLVPSAVPGGSGNGTNYQFLDTVQQAGKWVYWLVDVDTQGLQTPHPLTLTANITQSPWQHFYLPFVIK